MKPIRLGAVAIAAGALVVAPVITPVWAAPHPVAPSVHRTPLTGVDAAALQSAPAARASGLAAQPNGAAVAKGDRVTPVDHPAVFTRPLDTGRFTAAGVSWTSNGNPGRVVVQVRVRENGSWSDWRVLDEEGGPDAGSAEARSQGATVATQPYTSGSADGIQVRVDTGSAGPPPGLTLLTVDPGTSAADANLQQAPAGTAHGAAAQPPMVSRAQWGADESIRTCTPTSSTTIQVGFVHHTDGSNSYRPEDSAGLVRGIYAYHVQGNGWCDIGYNFLVDRFGTIFEGRYGSLTRPVIGAHTLAFNRDSVGVSAMGDFTTAAAPAAMTSSISKVLGWKLSLYNRSPRATAQLTSGGGTGAKWPAGTVVTFNVVSGHRDAYATDCPGDVVYGQLPAIRDAAAQYQQDTAPSGIDQYYATLGGILGSPTGPEVSVAGGRMRPYERGNIYWSAGTGAHFVWGDILAKYQALGGPSAFGFPSTDETYLAGGARSTFTGGSVLWSAGTGAHFVIGGILARYDAIGGPRFLGFPVTDEVPVAGGARSTFTGGSVLWSSGTGARFAIGGILAKYDAMGGPSRLGFPTTDEVAVPGGARSTFTGGSVLWSPSTGAHVVWGAILAKYDGFGGPAALGFPTTDEQYVAGGSRNTFTGGSVLWSAPTGAHVVIGGILAKYDSIGGPTSALGFPTTDEFAVPGGAQSNFEREHYIVWTPSTGAVVH